jgi:hypothetical protein
MGVNRGLSYQGKDTGGKRGAEEMFGRSKRRLEKISLSSFDIYTTREILIGWPN